MLVVVNVVAGGDLKHELDLESLQEDVNSLVYDAENHLTGLNVYISKDSPLLMLYRSGKYMITGAGGVAEAESVLEELTRILYNLGLDIDPSFSVYNVVFKSSISYQVDLDKLVLILGFENSEYEPEQSPFLVYRPEEHECVITIANSGMCVINGTTDATIARAAIKDLESIIESRLVG
jgi:transcription initiation factor TFIID TATA-box-binding protein